MQKLGIRIEYLSELRAKNEEAILVLILLE